MRALDRPDAAVAWELRGAWVTGRVVSLTLDRRASLPRVRGRVAHVAASGFYALVDDREAKRKGGPIHVPLALVLSVRIPHFSEPLDADPPNSEAPLDGQLSIYDYEGV